MDFKLLEGRILVLPDSESDTIGRIIQHETEGYRGFHAPHLSVPDPLNGGSTPEPIFYNHVIFVREGAVEIEFDNMTHLVMHRNNVVAVLLD